MCNQGWKISFPLLIISFPLPKIGFQPLKITLDTVDVRFITAPFLFSITYEDRRDCTAYRPIPQSLPYADRYGTYVSPTQSSFRTVPGAYRLILPIIAFCRIFHFTFKIFWTNQTQYDNSRTDPIYRVHGYGLHLVRAEDDEPTRPYHRSDGYR